MRLKHVEATAVTGAAFVSVASAADVTVTGTRCRWVCLSRCLVASLEVLAFWYGAVVMATWASAFWVAASMVDGRNDAWLIAALVMFGVPIWPVLIALFVLMLLAAGLVDFYGWLFGFTWRVPWSHGDNCRG